MNPFTLGFWMKIVLFKSKMQGMIFKLFAGLLIVLVYVLVYQTGGTQHAYLHAMYIPVVLFAVMFGWKGGVFIGLLVSIILGPLMPHDTITGEPQIAINWVFRMIFFVGVGGLVGLIVDMMRKQYQTITEVHSHSRDTGLPNYQKYLMNFDEDEQDIADVSLTVMLTNYEDVVVLIGRQAYADIMKEIYSIVKHNFNDIITIQVDARKFWVEMTQEVFKKQFHTFMGELDSKTFWIDDVPMYIDIAVGVYQQESDTNISRIEAFKASEMAALHAKKNKFKYSIYEHDFAVPHVSMERLGALPLAIKNNDLFLEYQPIIDLKTNKVTAFETLVRWRYKGKIIPPLDFIPIAEETRLIDLITEWIVDKVIEDYPKLSTDDSMKVMINVSQRNLYNPALIAKMINTIKKAKLKKQAIGIEMTESTVMLNLSLTRTLLENLREAGIPMAIDDFGKGYSTLSCLFELPIDKIKIDRDFVTYMFDAKGAEALIELIITYAHKLGIEVIAEGVETEAYEQALKDLGCDYGQGFYYAKPMPLDKVTKWLKNHNNK